MSDPIPTPPAVCFTSSFADPADYAAYKQAIADGKSEEEALAVGDNCMGYFGEWTGLGAVAMVALPPETLIAKWGSIAASKYAPLLVTNPANGKSVKAVVGDIMPRIKNITNGARMDSNPATCSALGLTPPVMAQVEWNWL